MASLEDFYASLIKRNQEGSFYRPMGQAILSQSWQSPRASVGANIAASLAQGLIGGFAMRQAKEQEAEYKKGLNEVLRGTLSGRSVFSPAVGSDDMELISAFKLQQDYEDALAERELRREIQYEELKNKAAKRGEQSAYLEMLGMAPSAPLSPVSPETPKALGGDEELTYENAIARNLTKPESVAEEPRVDVDKMRILAEVNPIAKGIVTAEDKKAEFERNRLGDLTNIRKEFNALPSFKNFETTTKAYDSLTKAIQSKHPVSDLELTRYGILMIEPGMAVREGEQAAVYSSASLPEEMRGAMLKALRGEAALTPQTRQGILELATRAYESHRTNYEKALDYYDNQARTLGLPEDQSISYLGKSKASEDIMAELGMQEIPPGMKLVRNKKTGETRLIPQ